MAAMDIIYLYTTKVLRNKRKLFIADHHFLNVVDSLRETDLNNFELLAQII